MDNYNYPEGSDTSDAPWNQPLDIKYQRFVSVTLSYYDEIELPPNASEEIIIEAFEKKIRAQEFPKKVDFDEIIVITEE